MTPPSPSSLALGAFLRAQRERLPAGESTGRRRRTPGLRREEVAFRAGMSAIWYMRIEQGKAAAVGAHCLARIADALQLDPAGRAHMFALAGRHDPAAMADDSAQLPDSLRQCVAQFDGPAYMLDPLWTVIAANDRAIDLFGPWMATGGNLLAFVFEDPQARTLIHGWQERARRLLAEFRLDYGRSQRSGAIAELVERLCANSPEFETGWNEQQVMGREGGTRAFDHPVRGTLHFDQLTLIPAGHPGMKLVLLFPMEGDSPASPA
jgi:transcriptional regulator with XRE-family HTH domain